MASIGLHIKEKNCATFRLCWAPWLPKNLATLIHVAGFEPLLVTNWLSTANSKLTALDKAEKGSVPQRATYTVSTDWDTKAKKLELIFCFSEGGHSQWAVFITTVDGLPELRSIRNVCFENRPRATVQLRCEAVALWVVAHLPSPNIIKLIWLVYHWPRLTAQHQQQQLFTASNSQILDGQ